MVSRKHLKRLLMAGILLLFVLAVTLGVLTVRKSILAMADEAAVARSELLDGARILRDGGANPTAKQLDRALQDFSSAETHFSQVNAQLSAGKVFRVANSLPWSKTQIRAAADLADMGVHLSRTGKIGVQALSQALAADPATPAHATSPGERMLATMQALDPKLGEITLELDQAAKSRAHLPSSGLLPQLSTAVKQLDAKVNLPSLKQSVTTLRAQEPGILHLLGGSGSKTYLVLQQDPAELRATGGFIGSVGFLTLDHGKLVSFNPVNVYSIDQDARGVVYGFDGASTHIPAPAPLNTTFHLNGWALRDSNWSPDFPTSARQAETFLRLEAHRNVDGVIAIDPYFISSLLSLIGPIKIPETGDVVDQNNFFLTTLNRVETSKAADPKSFLGDAAKAILPRLMSLPPSKLFTTLQVLSSACDRRTLQAYFHDPEAQALVSHYRCGGEVQPLTGDGIMLVDSNVGGNKDDFWLQRRYALRIELNTDGSAQHTLHIHYSGLTPHGVELTKYWGYTGWLRIYLPASSSLVTSSGAQFEETSDLGRHVLQGWVYVPFYKSLDVTVVYRVGAADMHASNGHLDLIWQKQAGRPADVASVEVTPPAGWKLTSAQVGKAQLPDPLSTDLSIDRAFAFTFRRS
jgi:hypothetical protein